MPRGWILKYYFVAFIDVLGQSKELLNLDKIPVTLEEKDRASYILHNTAGYIIRLRNGFKAFYRGRNKPTGILDSLPPDKRAKAERARSIEVIVKSISDTIIIAVPISSEDEHCVSIGSIYTALYGICGIYLAALVENKPFRSGIDIGLGVPLTKNEVYGGALVKAYMLEKSAKYPRIVVGDSLYDYLSVIQNQSSNTDYARLAKKWAGDSKLLIINDHDNLRVLDVIGEGVKSISGGIDKDIVEKAYMFVVQSHKGYKNSGDIELYFRYGYLRNYFESKLHLWNIQPIQ